MAVCSTSHDGIPVVSGCGVLVISHQLLWLEMGECPSQHRDGRVSLEKRESGQSAIVIALRLEVQ